LNTFLYRLACNSCGRGTRFQHNIYLGEPSSVSIGEEVFISNGFQASSELPGRSLRIGHRVSINPNVSLDYTGDLTVEDDVLISAEVLIYTHDHGTDPRSAPIATSLIIGRSAWIGVRSTILPGCSVVGQGAVVGAHSLVTKDVAPYTVVAGNPAKVIRVLEERSE
jgi:acetyltransferase-like isoleucine patch superfamily enzyme